MKRAHIHHKDGNPTNNPSDGSNWQVLCPGCHNKIPRSDHQGDGVYIHVIFTPWKRDEILKMKGNRCRECGEIVSSKIYPTIRRVVTCNWCDRIIPRKKDQIEWRDGRIMCK